MTIQLTLNLGMNFNSELKRDIKTFYYATFLFLTNNNVYQFSSSSVFYIQVIAV